jgi:hypothetical protein
MSPQDQRNSHQQHPSQAHTDSTSKTGGIVHDSHGRIQQVHSNLRNAWSIGVPALLRLLSSTGFRIAAARVAMCLALTVQLGLVFLSMYLIDLGVSLMELWVDLARKHLELTL